MPRALSSLLWAVFLWTSLAGSASARTVVQPLEHDAWLTAGMTSAGSPESPSGFVQDAPPGDWSLDYGMEVGPNLYAYVQQNPWTSFDPDGLAKEAVGEVYTAVNHERKEIYVGQTAGKGVVRVNKSDHPARGLMESKGTIVQTRKILAEDNWRATAAEEGLTEREARHRMNMVAERREFDDMSARFKGYKVINHSDKLLTSEKVEAYGKQYGVQRAARGELHEVNEPRRLTKIDPGKSNFSAGARTGRAIGTGLGVGALILMYAHHDAVAEDIEADARQWQRFASSGRQDPYFDTLTTRIASKMPGDSTANYLGLMYAAEQQRLQKKP